jgi:hypothetical protein
VSHRVSESNRFACLHHSPTTHTTHTHTQFADPDGGPYNNSFELSQKAAAHDLRGATAFLQHGRKAGLVASLQTLIDFAGFRLQAMQLLPLDSDSHVVGTCDACETLPFADPDTCKQFGYVADQLGLAEHNITVGGESVKLHFGADVEGHRGKDGKVYVLDTAYVESYVCVVC